MDYNKLMEEEISLIEKQKLATKPKLLLHACCGPCSSATIERLLQHFNITIYYYNPNIYPQEEYQRRKDELIHFVDSFLLNKDSEHVNIIEDYYIPQEFYDYINIKDNPHYATEPERGQRCKLCYELRLIKSFDYAVKNCYDYVTTTLSISPYKDATKINKIGLELQERYNIKFLFCDFKKKNGFLRSLELSKEYNMYRQDYCGCIYSLQNKK